MLAKGWCIGSETQMSQDNTISLYCHCSTDAITVMCSSTIKIWNFVVDEGIWSVVVVLMPHRASLFGEFWEREWAPANGEYTTFAFSSPKCCFPVWTKRYHQPLKTLPCKHTSAKINHLHAGALLDKHWPSTLYRVREWRFTSAWLNLNWNCEENEIKIAIKSEGIKHGERSKWESVKSGRVQQQMTEHEATEQRTGVNWFNSRRQPQQLPYRCSTAGSEPSHLQIWP